jgi:CDP-paratose 2-epimerase
MNCLITGGAGFIGCNVARRMLARGDRVTVFDNLSRKGARQSLDWLRQQGGRLEFVQADLRDAAAVNKAFRERPDLDVVLHLAAQVAVTTSVVEPREDFEINALGTFNVLEAVRGNKLDPVLIYASTNKVYGGMTDIRTVERNGRYEYADLPRGIGEERLLDFHSPYGCSKGAADQYVRDYARIYGLRTVVFRQSCIYGYRQFGVEDQGWVAWFTIAAALGKPITIYGDGKQVRDVLFVEDLADAYDLAVQKIKVASGQVYNIGGGARQCMSLLELLAMLEKFFGKKIARAFGDWRPGDQPVFVCDIAKAERELGWTPKVGVEEGVRRLYDWVAANRSLFD